MGLIVTGVIVGLPGVNGAKGVRRLWLEINDKDLFKSLRVCKPETQLGNTQSVLVRRKKDSHSQAPS